MAYEKGAGEVWDFATGWRRRRETKKHVVGLGSAWRASEWKKKKTKKEKKKRKISTGVGATAKPSESASKTRGEGWENRASRRQQER